MKTKLLSVVLLAALAGVSNANLLSNPGFQYGPDGTTNDHDSAQSWSAWGGASRENWGAKDVDGWLGSIHAWDGIDTGGWWQEVRVVPETAYGLQGYFSADATYTYSNLYLKLEFLDEAKVVVGVTTTLLNGVGTDWTWASVEGTSPVNAAWARAVIMADGQGLADAFKFDAISLARQSALPPAPPVSLLLNDGFAYGLDGTTNDSEGAQYWNTWGETSRTNWTSHDGDGWLASIHGWLGSSSGGWYQDVSATSNAQYRLSGYFSADVGYEYSGLFLKLEFRDESFALVGEHTTLLSGVDGVWSYREVDGTSPSNAVWVRAVVMAEGQGFAEELLIDDLNLSMQAVPALARLEPAYGVMAGASLTWGAETPAQFNERTGVDHACFVDFSDFPHLGGYDYLDANIKMVRDVGGIYVLTLEPVNGLAGLTSEDCAAFAGWCADWNSLGAPVMLRFAHEMNGSWYAWSMRPALYREKYRMLAEAIHATATNTAMVWAPNEAVGYPFNVYNGMTRATYTNGYGTLADWFLLDSNGDGVLAENGTLQDDPYAPFYPGDTHVDWVGMTVYHWGSSYPWWYNCSPEPRKFTDLITGSYSGFNGDSQWAPDFYATWAEGHAKPMMIPETAAYYRPSNPVAPDPYVPANQTNDEYAIKSQWLEQVYNIYGDNANALDLSVHFPRIRAINWFNIYKIENEAQSDWVNWTVTSNTAVTAEYRFRLESAKANRRYFLSASDLKGLTYGWNYSSDGWTYHNSAPFAVGLDTNQPYEGNGCLRVDFDNSASPYGVPVAGDYAAINDPLNTWSNNNAVHVRVRVPPGPNWATVRLTMESAEAGWDTLAYAVCPTDGEWHNLVFPYDWKRHDESEWLNLRILLDLPTNTASSVYFDALQVVVDSNTNGLTDAEEGDDDSDNLPDTWERAHGLDARTAADAGADADGDGLSNTEEYWIGTDPQDGDSSLRFADLRVSSTGVVTWEAMPHVEYIVQATDTLGGRWQDVSGSMTSAVDGWLSSTNEMASLTNYFYRIRAKASWLP